ncbi:MAG: acyl-CoA synthetase, partial [Ketobacter sp.]|nr:acyl-CoA synthetase [Ketobacter sp.]
MIKARIEAESTEANIDVYDETYQSFSWDNVEKSFTWHKTGKLNIAYEAIDRWAEHPQKRDKQALIFEKGHSVTDFSYLQLKELSCQWAGLLKEHGFATGDRLLIFLPSC